MATAKRKTAQTSKSQKATPNPSIDSGLKVSDVCEVLILFVNFLHLTCMMGERGDLDNFYALLKSHQKDALGDLKESG